MNKFGIILWLAGIAYIRCGEEPKPPTVKPTKPAPPPKCDGGWKKFGDKCYKKVQAHANFWDSALQCAQANAHLMTTIVPEADRDAFRSWTDSRESVWIGGTHMPEVRWIQGEVGLTPDDLAAPQWCFILREETIVGPDGSLIKQRQLKHQSCEATELGVCELTPGSTSLAPAIECEAGWTAAQHDQMCYKGSSDLRNFIEAKDYCVKEGGTMACASTPVENAFLFNYMAEQKYLAVWIGGSLDMKDKWSWLDDSEWGMAAWVDGKAPDTKTSRCLQLHGKSASIKPNWRRYWTGENCENAKTAVVCKKKPNKVTPADLDRKLHAGKK